jgi:mono/diheme cytochrome c family protein
MFILPKSIRILFLVPLGLGIFLTGCSNQPKDGQPLGAMYFKGYGCANCHRIGDEGGQYGPDLTFVGYRKTPQWLDVWFKNPHAWKSNTPMPNFNFPDNVRKALVEYLAVQKGDIYRKNPPWNTPDLMADSVKRGAVIYDRVGCVGCHGRNGVGGYPNNNVVGGKIPSLTKVAEGYSKEELRNKIRTGVHPAKADMSGAEPMIYMPEWGKVLKADEIDALADYLISLKPKSSSGESF